MHCIILNSLKSTYVNFYNPYTPMFINNNTTRLLIIILHFCQKKIKQCNSQHN